MRAVLLLAALLVSLAAPACAADIAAAQDVIRAQEQAFARGDAAAAYSHAAPAIREIFPHAEIFMQMVQQGYPPVYRHQSFELGEAWEALYTLEQQPDGSLKITGCSLLKAGQSA